MTDTILAAQGLFLIGCGAALAGLAALISSMTYCWSERKAWSDSK